MMSSRDAEFQFPENLVSVWIYPIWDLLSSEASAIMLNNISSKEKETWRRYAALEERDLFLRSHFLLRKILHELHSDISPVDWIFETNSYGKPSVQKPIGLEFNLTHTRGLIALAVAKNISVGIDALEPIFQSTLRDQVKDFFSENEWQSILNDTDPANQFSLLWTQKEAGIKCLGSSIDQARPETWKTLRSELTFHELSPPIDVLVTLAHKKNYSVNVNVQIVDDSQLLK